MRRNRDYTRRMVLKGLRDGLPIGLGYFAVAFSLGITARGAGVSPLQGWVASILNHASAGEYALYALIGTHAAVWETAAVIFVTNMRYLLMSAALSQKMDPKAGFLRRLGTGFCITDEIFGLAVAHPGAVSCTYLWTAFILADLMWAGGTLCGILAGNVLPANVVTALSVAIYGMFLAIRHEQQRNMDHDPGGGGREPAGAGAAADADPPAHQKPVYPFIPLLCTLCHTGGDDLPGHD